MLSDKQIQQLKIFLKKNNLSIDNLENIQIAFTHSSYTNANNLSYDKNYERLEFLGDSVLKLISSKYLFLKYNDLHEGELTKIRSVLVSDKCLAAFAKKLEIDKFILFGNVDFDTKKNIPSSILACAFEGLLGALYLSLEIKDIEHFLIKIFDEVIDEIKNETIYINGKAILQEYTQSLDKQLPEYVLKKEYGPEHDKIFEVDVYYNSNILASGIGKNKKTAQQDAAINACKKLGLIGKYDE